MPSSVLLSVELPVEFVEFDAEAKFARSKITTHAVANGPSEIEALPLIMPSSFVVLPVELVELDELDAATKCPRKLIAKATKQRVIRKVMQDMTSRTNRRPLHGMNEVLFR